MAENCEQAAANCRQAAEMRQRRIRQDQKMEEIIGGKEAGVKRERDTVERMRRKLEEKNRQAEQL